MDTGFAIILIGAIVLNVLLSIVQHRIYMGATRRMQVAYSGMKDHFLVSGRGKGILRGALVLLVIDATSNQIVAAEGMVGSTVMARFRPRPELLGLVTSAPSRAQNDHLLKAVEYALQQYRVVRRAAGSGSVATS